MINIVVGAGYGDEGKGHTVADLIEDGADPNIVIRFNGGQQAGHTVVKDGYRHVFSNFGAGTMHNIPTYWSEYCTIDLAGMRTEYELLVKNGYKPVLYIDPLCKVTTIFDMLKNRSFLAHGTVGVGFGTTIERNLTMQFHAIDLMYDFVAVKKFELVREFYQYPVGQKDYDDFFDDLMWFRDCPDIKIWQDDFEFENPIFEGAQGVLLDEAHGFFPHVTRSKTTAFNAFNLIDAFELDCDNITVNYVTRAYHTRHGNGPFHETGELKLRDDVVESNQLNDYQGIFKKDILDLDLVRFAITTGTLDLRDHDHYHHLNIVLTCVDHHQEETFAVRESNKIVMVNGEQLQDKLETMRMNIINGQVV